MANTTYDPWTITKREMSVTTAQSAIDNMSCWNIDSIESLSEEEAIIMAEDHEIIKGHDVYFIDFKGHFGYSCMVFWDHHIIRYAGDYELHHKGESREELHERYIKALNGKLYTDEELAAPLTDYHDYQRRCYYMSNYYGDRENHVSYFHIFNKEGVEEAYRAAIKDLHENPVCCGYYESAEFVKGCIELLEKIEDAKNAIQNDFDFWKKAFYYEFGNYECIYGGRYMEAAYGATNGEPLNEVQKMAYREAKKEYEKWCYEHDLP